jgi:START domain-containing protein
VRLVVILLAAVQFADLDAPDGWTSYQTRDGVTLERRKVEGSRFYEHRAKLDVAIDPARAADEIWAALRGGDMDSLKHRDVLFASADELVIYDQIRTPVVSDRDYTIVVRRVRDGARTQFRCETANERGPAEARGFVRIPIIRAGWQVEPDGHGGTRLAHFAYSEPGGSVPAWLVRGAQADRSMADMVRMVKRLRAVATAMHTAPAPPTASPASKPPARP